MSYDLIILGGGPGGYHAAERAAHAGLKTLCIEKRSLGGTCLNEGCLPTKTILYSAKLYDGANHGEKYGVSAENLTIDHAKVIARKNKVVRLLVGGVKSALKTSGAEVLEGEGRITKKTADGFEVTVGDATYTAKKVIIATGSVTAVPPIPGLKEQLEAGFVMTNREILAIDHVPARLIVLGGGVIGLEMASYFCSVGSEVTIVEMLDKIAGPNDRELTDILQKNYEKRGMKFMLGAKCTGILPNGVQYEKDGQEGTLEADCVLLSIGRKANSIGTGVEELGIKMERGAIVTDEKLHTSIDGIYAVGDCNGKAMLAHTAYREADVAVNDILGIEDTMNYTAIPAILYTNPELATVGESESSATAKGLDFRVAKLAMRYSGRYLAENEGGDGIMKLIVENGTDKVLGAQVLSNYSSEFIISIGILLEMGATVAQLKKIVFPHPTVGEIFREAAFAAEE